MPIGRIGRKAEANLYTDDARCKYRRLGRPPVRQGSGRVRFEPAVGLGAPGQRRWQTELKIYRRLSMAVQKSRKTPSKRDMRRSHDALSNPTLSVEFTTGEVHRRHHISPDGFYRGRKVVSKNA